MNFMYKLDHTRSLLNYCDRIERSPFSPVEFAIELLPFLAYIIRASFHYVPFKKKAAHSVSAFLEAIRRNSASPRHSTIVVTREEDSAFQHRKLLHKKNARPSPVTPARCVESRARRASHFLSCAYRPNARYRGQIDWSRCNEPITLYYFRSRAGPHRRMHCVVGETRNISRARSSTKSSSLYRRRIDQAILCMTLPIKAATFEARET